MRTSGLTTLLLSTVLLFHWKTVGQVKVGYNADLLVLNADPLQGVENLKNIHSV